MKIIASSGLAIEVEASQCPMSTHIPVVLISGLGLQLTDWPASWLEKWQQQNTPTVLLDNRDTGLSDRFIDHQATSTPWFTVFQQLARGEIRPPYSLSDMAQDIQDVLTHLHITRYHLVGFSMGGMIAQHIAINNTANIASLVCISTSSNAPGLPLASPAIWKTMFKLPLHNSQETALEYGVALWATLAGRRYPIDQQKVRARLLSDYQRSAPNLSTILRQAAAVMADSKRFASLSSITCPALIIHGSDDPLLPIAHGESLGTLIFNSSYLPIDGMGHDIPCDLQAFLFDHITHFQSQYDS